MCFIQTKLINFLETNRNLSICVHSKLSLIKIIDFYFFAHIYESQKMRSSEKTFEIRGTILFVTIDCNYNTFPVFMATNN